MNHDYYLEREVVDIMHEEAMRRRTATLFGTALINVRANPAYMAMREEWKIWDTAAYEGVQDEHI